MSLPQGTSKTSIADHCRLYHMIYMELASQDREFTRDHPPSPRVPNFHEATATIFHGVIATGSAHTIANAIRSVEIQLSQTRSHLINVIREQTKP